MYEKFPSENKWRFGPRGCPLLSQTVYTALIVVGIYASGCGGSQQLSGQDLLGLKRQEIQERYGTLTEQEELAILGIRASTKSEFESEVDRVLEESQRSRNLSEKSQ